MVNFNDSVGWGICPGNRTSRRYGAGWGDYPTFISYPDHIPTLPLLPRPTPWSTASLDYLLATLPPLALFQSLPPSLKELWGKEEECEGVEFVPLSTPVPRRRLPFDPSASSMDLPAASPIGSDL